MFVVLRDGPVYGPCSNNPDAHARKRRDHWEEVYSTLGIADEEALKALRDYAWHPAAVLKTLRAFPPDAPIAIWTSMTWTERLKFWWMCWILARAPAPRQAVYAVEVQHSDGPHGDSSLHSFRSMRREHMNACFLSATSMSAEMIWDKSKLWELYANEHAAAFDEKRRSKDMAGTDIHIVGDAYGWFFPRVHNINTSSLRLSVIDQALLGSLSDRKWSKPAEVIMRTLQTAEGSVMLSELGDLFFPYRLSMWSSKGGAEVVQKRGVGKGDNLMTNVEYKLSSHGRALVDGLSHDKTLYAPKTHVGGCAVSDGVGCWVRTECEEYGWRIARWSRLSRRREEGPRGNHEPPRKKTGPAPES